ncbi:uncharacterized protein [Miscanthus floridulus]|uniref:uncharacterized protein n=1 Tax=Miscanthus floridulus TaxID=154761 RepID=UPI003459D7FB
MSALEAILAAIPEKYREPLGAKSSAKEAWEAIAAMCISSDHAKKAMTQLLKQKYANLKFGRLRAVNERLEQAIATKDSGKLLLIEEEWAARRNFEVASSSHSGDGKRHGKTSLEKKKQAEEKEEVTTVEGPGKALKAINLDEPRTQVHPGRMGGEWEQRWYLDSGASNHMTGFKAAFSELNDDVTGTVKFGDGSRLRSSIISISQLDERGSQVLIKDGVIRIRDREQRLLTKLEKMVRGLPHIEHGGELCESYRAEKQRRLSFPKVAKYRSKDALELIHGDLFEQIMPATNGGRQYFLLLMDDCSRYMWLQLLTSKDKAVAVIKKFKMHTEVESGKKLHVLRTDRSSEFTSVEFAAYCMDQGVVRHHTMPYSP